jgi:hypothetical protein
LKARSHTVSRSVARGIAIVCAAVFGTTAYAQRVTHIGGGFHPPAGWTPPHFFTPTRTFRPTRTPTPTPLPCVGDCNGDREVTIGEVVKCVNLSQGQPLSSCPVADANGDGVVTIDEVVQCVNGFQNGCP